MKHGPLTAAAPTSRGLVPRGIRSRVMGFYGVGTAMPGRTNATAASNGIASPAPFRAPLRRTRCLCMYRAQGTGRPNMTYFSWQNSYLSKSKDTRAPWALSIRGASKALPGSPSDVAENDGVSEWPSLPPVPPRALPRSVAQNDLLRPSVARAPIIQPFVQGDLTGLRHRCTRSKDTSC